MNLITIILSGGSLMLLNIFIIVAIYKTKQTNFRLNRLEWAAETLNRNTNRLSKAVMDKNKMLSAMVTVGFDAWNVAHRQNMTDRELLESVYPHLFMPYKNNWLNAGQILHGKY